MMHVKHLLDGLIEVHSCWGHSMILVDSVLALSVLSILCLYTIAGAYIGWLLQNITQLPLSTPFPCHRRNWFYMKIAESKQERCPKNFSNEHLTVHRDISTVCPLPVHLLGALWFLCINHHHHAWSSNNGVSNNGFVDPLNVFNVDVDICAWATLKKNFSLKVMIIYLQFYSLPSFPITFLAYTVWS